MDGQEFVETVLNFASPDLRGFRAPGGYTQQHARLQSGEPMRSGQQKVKLWNARLLDPPPTLETHGFQLIAHEPIQWNLQDMSVVRNEFYPWCRELIRKVTNCAEVRGGSNEFRRPPGLPTPNGSGGGYASGIHSDMSPGIELGWQSGDDDRHFESINVWRTAESEFDIEMMPLCLCAMNTMAPGDIVFGDGQVSWMPCNVPVCELSSDDCQQPSQWKCTEHRRRPHVFQARGRTLLLQPYPKMVLFPANYADRDTHISTIRY